MEQFASLNEDSIKVVGVGILDNQRFAEEFYTETGMSSADVVWSEDRGVWLNYEVRGQHTTILLDANGAEAQRWNNFNADDIAQAIA